MRVISTLAALALTGSAVAGPLHGNHGKLHRRNGRKHPGFHYIHANTTTSAIGSGVSGSSPSSSIVEPYPADPSIPAPAAPTTSDSGSAIVAPASECGASPETVVEGVATETQTKTITSTLTYTTTDGPSTYVTTSTKVETIKIIVKYTTIVVPGPNSPAPTSPPTTGSNGGSSSDDGTVPVDGESVPSTGGKNSNGNGSGSDSSNGSGSGSGNGSGNFPGNYPSDGSDNGSGNGSENGSGSGSDNGSGNGSGSDSDSDNDGNDDWEDGSGSDGSGSTTTSVQVPPYPTNLPTYPNGTASYNGSYPVTPGLHFGSKTKKTKKHKKTKKVKTTTKKAIKTTPIHSTKRRNPTSSSAVVVNPVKTSSSTTTARTSAPTTRAPTTRVSSTTSKTTTSSTSSAVDGVPPPNQTGANTVKGCQKWYTPVSGDWCSKVADANGITVSDFISWNPSVGSDCTTMYAGWSYCVAIKIGGASTTASQRASTTIQTTVRPTTSPAVPTTTTASAITTRATTTPATSAAPTGVPAPSPIREDVPGCTKWDLVVSGDTCDVFAARNGVSSSSIISLNPSVGSNCGGLWLGYYFCVSTSASGTSPTTSRAATTSTTPYPSSTANPSPGAYHVYRGSGSVADGWPSQSQWLDFDTMWRTNLPNIGTNCGWMTDPSGAPVVANTAQETADLRSAIVKIADANSLPRSFVLAIVQQESNGCVRVHTTFNPVRNPGLMQTHNGAGTCNDKSQSLYLLSPQCTASRIEQMVIDGVQGTTDGDGLVQTVAKSGYASGQVARWYAGARIYNGGEAGGNWNRQDLSVTAGTRCYASDVANRLTGWAQGTSGCEDAVRAGTL
ncbi:hypothetical protein BDZ85DRAFT_222027 [Elsinoe ampelina]|uniref:LysM domain-containing protein n=1 Tax=Elsinoe ampelina TaxID=302913 RepID=A0A6A6G5H4_9PEZI|nr:hypothetical protein BDZ85DRAFT_222027 [Elsinoe ampelina]